MAYGFSVLHRQVGSGHDLPLYLDAAADGSVREVPSVTLGARGVALLLQVDPWPALPFPHRRGAKGRRLILDEPPG